MLQIKNLSVVIDNKAIIKNVSFSIGNGSIHVIMGPNGSGKSTLAYTLAGHPDYQITSGSVFLNSTSIFELSPDKRARLGLFLAFQQPFVIPGVRISTFLKEAHYATTGDQLSVLAFNDLLNTRMRQLEIDVSFADRCVNEGFSGGEKKRFEMLQMLILQPSVVILDEIDSGLDIDALKVVTKAVHIARKENPRIIFLIITHYQRILQYITPDYVHILVDGRLAKSGDLTLVDQLEQKGYDEYRNKEQQVNQ